jgi:hypothetical protein
MRFAAGFTATGIIGFLLFEALKIVMAPVAAWVLGVVMVAVKVMALVGGAALLLLAIAGSVWGYRRWSKAREEAAY